jgi:hypothetical protein
MLIGFGIVVPKNALTNSRLPKLIEKLRDEPPPDPLAAGVLAQVDRHLDRPPIRGASMERRRVCVAHQPRSLLCDQPEMALLDA